MNWKSLGKKSLFVATGVFALGVVLSANALKPHWQDSCDTEISQPLNAQSPCALVANEKVNWFDWIGGKSRSYQFHFLDLLELLYSNDSESRDSMGSSAPTGSM
ncbi:hypothetical protein [Alteromonas facilis]|uniref:hypothetical protein n=1 Tax=Alteromonas facilis TaxID=2048004 RepID=UPI000C28E709|nr:hypothetical protein [Alteromonas facilis]